MKLWLLLCAALLLVCGCAENGENGAVVQPTIEPVLTSEPTESTVVLPSQVPLETVTIDTAPETFSLDEENLEIRLVVQPEIIDNNPEALVVTILAIENEALNGFSVFASLAWLTVGQNAGTIPLGAFSIFPADQPGRYTLSVRNGLADLREAVGDDEISDLTLTLKIEPVSTAVNLAGLKVRFAAPTWR